MQVVRRFLERSVEQRPSVLSTLGLNAIQLLSWESSELRGDAGPSAVTIVFTDLEGFTRFTADHGDDAAIALLDDHHKLVGPIVRSRGGRIVKRLGDGLMLLFPAGEAAVLAALELPGDRAGPAPVAGGRAPRRGGRHRATTSWGMWSTSPPASPSARRAVRCWPRPMSARRWASCAERCSVGPAGRG